MNQSAPSTRNRNTGSCLPNSRPHGSPSTAVEPITTDSSHTKEWTRPTKCDAGVPPGEGHPMPHPVANRTGRGGSTVRGLSFLALSKACGSAPGAEVGQRPEGLNNEREHPGKLRPSHVGSGPSHNVPQSHCRDDCFNRPGDDDRPLLCGGQVTPLLLRPCCHTPNSTPRPLRPGGRWEGRLSPHAPRRTEQTGPGSRSSSRVITINTKAKRQAPMRRPTLQRPSLGP